jgi:[CysO sulfur-carrier protein]-S-L-cysteine hydrolase
MLKDSHHLNFAIIEKAVVYKLRRDVFNAMEAHAEQSYPNECCGLLGGMIDLFVEYYPLTNCAEIPTKNYLAAPEELFQAMQRMRSFGQEQLGIYHSHPVTSAYPSTKDIQMAYYPTAINFIFSLHPMRELSAFEIEDGTVTRVEFTIVD